MTIKMTGVGNYRCLQVRVMIAGKSRSRSFSLRNPQGLPMNKAEIAAVRAEAKKLDNLWLAEQQQAKGRSKIRAEASERNKTTPVRGISASVYAGPVNAVYWRFQVGVQENGIFKSRSFQVKRGAEKLAWVAACTALAQQHGVEPEQYIRRWPGAAKMRAVFTALQDKRA